MSSNPNPNLSFFRTDRTIKGLSLLLAFIFWSFVKLSKEYRTSADFAVEWQLPDTLAWTSTPPTRMRVNYDGNGWALMGRFSRQNLNFQPNYLQVGETTMDHRQLMALLERQVPNSVHVIDFSPDNIKLNFDYRVRKRIPVQALVEPKIQPGFTTKGNIVVRPDSVFVSGPKQVIEKITFAKTTTWEPQDIKRTTTQSLSIQDETHVLFYQPSQVAVTLDIEQYTEKSFFVPIELQNVLDSIRIFPNKVKITFAVPLSQFDSVQPSDFILATDFSQIKLGSTDNTLPIQVVQQPNFIENLRFRSKAIEFFITKD